MPATPVISTEPSPTTVPSIALATASSVTFIVDSPRIGSRYPFRETTAAFPQTDSAAPRWSAADRSSLLSQLLENAIGEIERPIPENDVPVRSIQNDRVAFVRTERR